jgi:hypothetical protein
MKAEAFLHNGFEEVIVLRVNLYYPTQLCRDEFKQDTSWLDQKGIENFGHTTATISFFATRADSYLALANVYALSISRPAGHHPETQSPHAQGQFGP